MAAHLPTTRLPDWQPRLAALFAQRLGAPFQWGLHDCCLFAADAVLAVTGHDPAADLRGAYACEETAAQVMAAAGGLAALARARAGGEVAVFMAQPGDIGLCLQTDPRALALAVFGGNVWHAPGPQGLVAHPVASISTAWRCTAA